MSSLDLNGESCSGVVRITCPKLATWYVAETRGLLLDVTRSGAILSGLGTGGQWPQIVPAECLPKVHHLSQTRSRREITAHPSNPPKSQFRQPQPAALRIFRLTTLPKKNGDMQFTQFQLQCWNKKRGENELTSANNREIRTEMSNPPPPANRTSSPMHASLISTRLTVGKLLGLTFGLYHAQSSIFLRTAALFYVPLAALPLYLCRK